MTTLKDIAKIADVSISTVSRVLSQDRFLSIPLETRQKILTTAATLGYKKKVRQTKVFKIALIHWYTRAQELEDTYYLSIRLAIETCAHEQAIDLIKVFHDDNDKPLEPCDGAIAVGKFDSSEIKRFNSYYPYIVFVDSSPDETNYDSVVIDIDNAYVKAHAYLNSLGLHDIGYIGGREYTHDLNEPIYDRREQFFTQHLNQKSKLSIGTFSIASGYELMKKNIDEHNLAEAYLIASDAMAIGALSALYEANIEVPEQVSIIGFNDIPQSAYTIPPLTTIKVYKEHMGSLAINLLLERINGRDIAQKIVVQTKLIIRKSTREEKKNGTIY